ALGRDGSGDADGDGAPDGDEFRAGTSPINGLSVLKAVIVAPTAGDPQILWSAVPGRTYRVQFKDDVTSPTWENLPGDVTAGSSTGMAIDDTGTGTEDRFYRVLLVD
ncbi:MAG TPA: hypothetical protein DCY13_12690, partial [Verrucomicrobiales bacterium]|nr:hypothetical protein [Verrucomicrobiales bacterium]